MQEALRKAGFDEVIFEYEPNGAAARYAGRLHREELIVVADYGGGTTDFSVVRVGRARSADAILPPAASRCRATPSMRASS
ncbi:MAG: hypothetical protein HC863_01290, partial [Myxococcales bacterium]|nr:hypothetical protein [Myxococcales bacterium]